MHPAVRIISLIISLGFLAYADIWILLCGLFITTVVAWRDITQTLHLALKYILRLRWLFLSMLVLYLVFTPGEAIFNDSSFWSPSRQGVSTALHRISAWVIIIYVIALFSIRTTQQQWLAGIIGLCMPLKKAGIDAERVAIRMALTLRVIEMTDFDVKTFRNNIAKNPGLSSVEKLAGFIQSTIARIEQSTVQPITIDSIIPPSFKDWSVPITIVLLFGVLFTLEHVFI